MSTLVKEVRTIVAQIEELTKKLEDTIISQWSDYDDPDDCTCSKCVARALCPYAFDPYNQMGDCLASK